MMKIGNGDLFGLYVAYVPGPGGKRRPVVVFVGEQQQLRVMPITTKYTYKSDRIKRQYYTIQQWQAAGLTEPSWIDIRDVRALNRREFLALRPKPFGQLTIDDLQGLLQFIKEYWSRTND